METLFMQLKQLNKINMNDVASLTFILSEDTIVPTSNWSGKQDYLNNGLFNISGESKI